MFLDEDGNPHPPRLELIGGRTREEFVGVAAGFIMSAVLAKDAHLAINHDMRPDILKRSAGLAAQAAPMLWEALTAPGMTEPDASGLHAEWAIRNLSSILGWWAELACSIASDRESNVMNAVITAVKGATALWTELYENE